VLAALQHVPDRAFHSRESFCASRARSTTFVLTPIGEWMTPDCNLRIDLSNLAELHTNVALARICAHVSESMQTPTLKSRQKTSPALWVMFSTDS
jgi:hypothetical protein